MLNYLTANAWYKRKRELREFLPPWVKIRKPVQDPVVLGAMLDSWARSDAASRP